MVLYDPGRHEPLDEEVPWDPDRAGHVVGRIAADAVSAWDPDRLFPWHPQDAEYAPPSGEGAHGLYFGAAGVWWALCWLVRVGAVDGGVVEDDPADVLHALARRHLEAPDLGEVSPSWLIGATGVLAAAQVARPDPALADRTAELVEANRDNPTLEMLWGAPGTLEGARLLAAHDPDPRWLDLFRDGATRLLAALQRDEASGCRVWEQDLYGQRRRLVGAGHGLFGNLHPLLEGLALLPPDQQETVCAVAEEALVGLAIRHAGRAAFPSLVDGDDTSRTQWCHGSPGVITSLRSFPRGRSDAAEQILAEAGEHVWAAGPLKKGPGLCHGTAGNGWALLVLHRRTGEDRWLERARAFAMHAVGQWDEARRRHGRGRYSLWTGDLGLACYLHACLHGDDRIPTLDVL